MIHPLFRLIAAQPHMVAEHIEAYSDLVLEEMEAMGRRWKRQVLLLCIALAAVVLTAVLFGVALMLYAVTPEASLRFPWLLVAVPLVPALITVACLFAARSQAPTESLKNIRQQFAADVAMLREVSAP